MKFSPKKSITLSFCLAFFGATFNVPIRAEVFDTSTKIVESNSEVNFSGQIPEINSESPSKIFDESLVPNQSQSLQAQLVYPENPVNTIDRIDDWSSVIPIETPLSEPDEPSTTAKPESNKAGQLAQSAPAQGDELVAFRRTRGGYSYVGIAGNFGITGDSDLGGRSLAIISKIGLSESFSVRPSVLFLSNFATFLIPITYDFAPRTVFGPDFALAPYLGGGIAIKTGSDNTFGPLITAGVDLPISRTFTVTAAANLSFLRRTDFGILVGIAYNF